MVSQENNMSRRQQITITSVNSLMTVFQEIVVESMNTTKPNHMILVSFFSEDNVLSDELKLIHAIFLNFKETKIERSAFWDTWYNVYNDYNSVQ